MLYVGLLTTIIILGVIFKCHTFFIISLFSIVLLKVIMGGRFCMWFVDFYAVFLSASSSSFSKLSETPLPRPKTCLAILSMYI